MIVSTRFLSLNDHRNNSNDDGEAFLMTGEAALEYIGSIAVTDDNVDERVSKDPAPEDADLARCFSTELAELYRRLSSSKPSNSTAFNCWSRIRI